MKALINRSLLALVVLLLGANLIVVQTSGRSMMEPETLEWTFFGAMALIGVWTTISGIRSTTKARKNRDRSSFVWARRGFAVTLFIVLALVADALTGKPIFHRDNVAVDFAFKLLFVVVGPIFFAIAYHRDYVRSRSSSRGRS